MEKHHGCEVRLPILKSAPITMSDTAIYVHLGGQRHMLCGRHAANVVHDMLPRVDGLATRDELVADIAHTTGTPEDQVAQILDRLVETGICVVDRAQTGDDPWRRHYLTQIAHFGQHVTYPTDCQRRLQKSHVAIIGAEYLGSLLAQHLALAGIGRLRTVGPTAWSLAETPFLGHRQHITCAASRHTLLTSQTQNLGFATAYEGVEVPTGSPLDLDTLVAGCDLVVLMLPQRLPTLLRAVNQACLARHVPFLPVWLEATGAHIGPLVMPSATPCWLCFELRQSVHLSLEEFRAMQCIHTVTLPPWEDTALLLPWALAVTAIAACDIVEALAQYRRPSSYGHALFIPMQDWRLQPTPVSKHPRCPACSPLRAMPSPQPFVLPAQEESCHDA